MAAVSEATTSTSTESKTPDTSTTQASKSTEPLTAPSTEVADPTADFEGDLDVNNDVPSTKDILEAADLPILDADGTAYPFKSLYTKANGTPKRALIIFVRHFFCGNCQEYLRTLCASMSPESLASLPTPTTLSIIGCGSPSLISMYASSTSCTFAIYADPSYKLYSRFGMTRTLSLGPKKPDYLQSSQVYNALKSIVQSLSAGTKAMKGGDYNQVGGEFLWEEGKVVWCHRMRNTRDHAEIPVLRDRLGLDGPGGVRRRKSTGPAELLKRTSRSWSRRRSMIMTGGDERTGSDSAKERDRSQIREEIRSEQAGVDENTNGGKTNGHAPKA
ncbi:MAG: hypothetical protein M1836_006926 [Candelina mexicana]|nr:MAG: hypothetical protein M1836_006926 [Candelina mexicana]